MFFYIISSLLLIAGGLVVSYARKDMVTAKFFYYLIFLYLTFFSAVRYGIGTDYPHYNFFYNAIGNGNLVYKKTEPIFYYLNLFCYKLNFDYKLFVAICSFITVYVFFKSTSKDTFFYDASLFYTLIYVQSFCLIRQMMACVIAIYALRKYRYEIKKCLFYLIVASLIHKTFFILIILYLLSYVIRLNFLSTIILSLIAFVLFYFTDIIPVLFKFVYELTGIRALGVYMSFSRHLGAVMLTRYIYMICFLFLFKFNSSKNDVPLVYLLFLFILVSEFAGTRVLVLASRLPQTCFCVFFLVISEVNIIKINSKIKNNYFSMTLVLICLILLLLYLVLFVQLTTGNQLNRVVPYQSIF